MLDDFYGVPVDVELYNAKDAEFQHMYMTQSNLVEAKTCGKFNTYIYKAELQCPSSYDVLPFIVYISECQGRMAYNMEVEGQPSTYESYFFVF
jgi:hypothetical protein